MTNPSALKVKITAKKKLKIPPRTLCHGEPGVGKTTFASNAPDVVFLCIEKGSNNMAVQRVRIEDSSHPEGERDPSTFLEVITVLDSLIAAVVPDPAKAPFKNVAIDTADALEALIHAHVCKMSNKKSMSEFGFNKGFDTAVEAYRMVLARLERLNENGIGIITLAHTQTSHFNNPEAADFDFYDIKLHKKISGLLVEWHDNVLFARRDQHAFEEGGKVRGVSSGARFLNTTKSPAFIAKNRFDLPERMPLSWEYYQAAMDNHSPADPAELLEHANKLIAQLEKGEQKTAIEALKKIDKKDAKTLAHFVDYCRGKLTVNKPVEEQNQETQT